MRAILSASLIAIALLGAPAAWAEDENHELPPDRAPAKPAPAPSLVAAAKPAEATPAKPVEAAPAKPVEATPAAATNDIPTVLLGLGAGVYIPTSKLGVNFLVGIDGSYQLPWLGGRFGIGAGLAYSQPTTDGTITDDRLPGQSADYESTMRELVLDFLLSFRVLGWDSIWSPHLGIGPVIYFLSHKVTSLEVEQTESSTQAGFIATVGVDVRVWHGALIGEARIPFATVGQRTTGDSNVGAVGVLIGYRFRF